MITYRIRYGKYVMGLSIPKKQSGKTVIMLPGLPASTSNKELVRFLLSLGCVVFQPDYSGTNNSSGVFSIRQCVDDTEIFLRVARNLAHKELYYSKKIKIATKEIIVIASSFGASVAILAKKTRVRKLILLSPVLLYNQKDINNLDKKYNFKVQMSALYTLITKAFTYTYRVSSLAEFKSDLLGLSQITSSDSMIRHLKHISVPTLILQGKADKTLSTLLTRRVLEQVSNKNISCRFLPRTNHNVSNFPSTAYEEMGKFILSN